jgi:hypothetical protein
MKFLLLSLIILGSCTFKKNNQKLKGHEELYSEAEAPELIKLESNEKRIVVAATNDLHGNYALQRIHFQDNHNQEEQSVLLGSSEIISRYFSILRETFENVVLVDSGDIFSTGNEIEQTRTFYESNKYDAVTVGLRDFNLQVPQKYSNNIEMFKDFAKKNEVPLLLSNLYELKTARVVEWAGTKPHVLKEVNGIKVGFVGLVSDDISSQTPVNNRVGLYIEDMVKSTIRHATVLRSLGAQVIVVLTHQGMDCGKVQAELKKLPLKKVNFDPENEKSCDETGPLGVYLERLPPGLVDVVVGGRTHNKIANLINGTVVMSSFPDAQSFSYAEIVINTETNKLVPKKTVIHQPVMFCHEFFKETKDCFWEDSTVNHKKRIPATFLGKPVQTDNVPEESSEVQAAEEKQVTQIPPKFEADLSYFNKTKGHTQIVALKLSGKELMDQLEEDFNRGHVNQWVPSPFIMKGDSVVISIKGKPARLNAQYTVLTDLESLQKHPKLLKKISSLNFDAYMNDSLHSLEQDSVSTTLAGQSR